MFRHIHKYFKDNLQSLQKESDGVCTEELVGGGLENPSRCDA